MSQPITIDGHSKKVTLSFRAPHKLTAGADGVTTIELDAQPGSAFAGLVVKNEAGQVTFRTGEFTTSWNVTIA